MSAIISAVSFGFMPAVGSSSSSSSGSLAERAGDLQPALVAVRQVPRQFRRRGLRGRPARAARWRAAGPPTSSRVLAAVESMRVDEVGAGA